MKKYIFLFQAASLLLLASFSPMLHADAVQRLKAFYQSAPAMKAQFRQAVLDRKGQKVQEVTGVMQLLRPGKFRWDYHKPYLQLIIGDGKKVWMYDPDLNQVTVHALDKVLGSSPAALLAGNNEMEKVFELRNDVRQDGLEWVEALPREKDGSFERVLLGFKGEQLAEMELHDSFAQTTIIEFSNVELNPKFDTRAFKFTPPAGVDVVGE